MTPKEVTQGREEKANRKEVEDKEGRLKSKNPRILRRQWSPMAFSSPNMF